MTQTDPLPTPSPGLPWYTRYGSPLVLVVGVITYVVVLLVMVSTDNINLFPTLLLVGAVTVPLSVLMLAYATDRPAPGSGAVLAFTAIAGGVIGTTTAGLLEYRTLKSLPWLGMLGVGAIEEAAKLLVPLLVLLVARRRTRGMGIVVGIASGAGFAVLETMGYGLSALIESRGNMAEVDGTLLLRGLLSPASHVAWTGLTVWALWRIGATPPVRHAVRDFVGCYLLAVLLHATWDGIDVPVVHVGVVVISLAILLTLILRSRPSREHGGTRDTVPGAPGRGFVE
ncbi:PrsW family intramembrane metalloprotease [Actinomyces polynesiensis]|uniref:PrsW family intramembrane metalloprotease n=1 Tax=Actinomyces polynesiensis TaxID=1325934 RepID=UPI0009E1FAB0|nr:PrsW family intramembrane metalloprotease [Actinomyces polynesiensis]